MGLINVLDIDPGVHYTINCEDFGDKRYLTILGTYATVNKMGVNPPNSTIEAPVEVPDNVWPEQQYLYCLNSGVEDDYRRVLPPGLVSSQDYVLPASCEVPVGTQMLSIRSSGDAANVVWLAPAGSSEFAEGPTMTRADGNATEIPVPASPGTYKLHLVSPVGDKVGESRAELRVK